MKIFYVLATILLLVSCGQSTDSNSKNGSSSNGSGSVDSSRNNPKSEPVQQYEEKVANDLNNWFFRVKLYETSKRFTYRVSLQHEELTGEDEINFPNLGMDPQPVIKKGTAQYECIIGFTDQQGAFREYKKVHVVDGNLKITTLKSYAVTAKPE
ncbi:MAG: hypothetical protein V4722_07810 [Bacteroidota bacterium]